MASSYYLTRATKLFSRSNLRVFPARSFHLHANTPISKLDIDEDEAEAYQILKIDGKSEMHPFQTSGPRTKYVVTRLAAGDCIRMEMPGVGQKHIKVWVEGMAVFYKARSPALSEYEKGVRQFSGSFTFVGRREFIKKEDVRCEVVNGVARILVPTTINVEDRKGITVIEVE